MRKKIEDTPGFLNKMFPSINAILKGYQLVDEFWGELGLKEFVTLSFSFVFLFSLRYVVCLFSIHFLLIDCCPFLFVFLFSKRKEEYIRDIGKQWKLFMWPKLILEQVARVNESLDKIKAEFYETMLKQQEEFKSSVMETEQDIEGFAQYTDSSKIKPVMEKVRKIEARLKSYSLKVIDFNANERLFDVEVCVKLFLPSCFSLSLTWLSSFFSFFAFHLLGN